MKKILLMFGMIVFWATTAQADVEINEENFPDDAFRSVIASMPEGMDGILTDEEIAGIEELVVLWGTPNEVFSLKGIEFFTNLKVFDFAYRFIKELDLSANKKLEFIRLDLGLLEKLNISGLTSLKSLICLRGLLTELDVSTCTSLEYFCCKNNSRLTSLDLSNNTRLKVVHCSSNQLTSLDLTNNINLKELDCSYNQLTSIILPQSEMLSKVECYANHLSGESMDQLLASLPTVAKGELYPYIEVADDDEEGPQTEFNVCTTSQVEVAKSKNWTVYGIYHVLGEYWEEYSGSETTAIQNPRQNETTSDCYTIDGRRLDSQPTNKGIYIQNGKKVVIK